MRRWRGDGSGVGEEGERVFFLLVPETPGVQCTL